MYFSLSIFSYRFFDIDSDFRNDTSIHAKMHITWLTLRRFSNSVTVMQSNQLLSERSFSTRATTSKQIKKLLSIFGRIFRNSSTFSNCLFLQNISYSNFQLQIFAENYAAIFCIEKRTEKKDLRNVRFGFPFLHARVSSAAT